MMSQQTKLRWHACRALLAERGAHTGMRWSKLKEALAKDKRYKALPRDLRETLFRTYVAEKEARQLSC